MVDPVALEIAKKSDAVILCVGFNNQSESEGGDRSFELPVGQEQLIDQVAAGQEDDCDCSGGKKSVAMEDALIRNSVPEQGGTALARLLFGETKPIGPLCHQLGKYNT